MMQTKLGMLVASHNRLIAGARYDDFSMVLAWIRSAYRPRVSRVAGERIGISQSTNRSNRCGAVYPGSIRR